MEPQASITYYTAKGCLKKIKDEKRENVLLDSRQPFMNRVGKIYFAHAGDLIMMSLCQIADEQHSVEDIIC